MSSGPAGAPRANHTRNEGHPKAWGVDMGSKRMNKAQRKAVHEGLRRFLSVLLSLAKLPFSVLVKLLTLVVPALAFGLGLLIPNIQMHIIMVLSLLYFVFLVAFHKLITVSYANWLCETYMNPQIGAKTNIGLRPENWDDVQYIPQDDEE